MTKNNNLKRSDILEPQNPIQKSFQNLNTLLKYLFWFYDKHDKITCLDIDNNFQTLKTLFNNLLKYFS